jgi:dienelactone hydrolase
MTVRFGKIGIGLFALICCAQPPLPNLSYSRDASLEFREALVKDYGYARLLDISYVSPHGGRVTAYAVIPDRPPHPAGIVWQHGEQGDRASLLPDALTLAQRGAASILINAPWLRQGARRAATPKAQRADWLHSAVDIRRAIDVLLDRWDISPRRLAYVGQGYGATLGGILGPGERRFQTLVLMGGSGMAPGLPALDVRSFITQAAPAALLFQFARYDRGVSKEQAESYATSASNPKEVRWYDCGREFNDAQSARDRIEFLDKQLGLSTHVAGAEPALLRRQRQDIDPAIVVDQPQLTAAAPDPSR